MKPITAAQAKGRYTTASSASKPKEGSQLRALYDYFMSRKGKVVKFSSGSGAAAFRLDTLRDRYGMDIRKIKQGRWVFAGEWFDNKYVDYIARKITPK